MRFVPRTSLSRLLQHDDSSVWLSPSDSEVMTELSSEYNQGTLYLSLCLKGPQFPFNKTSQMVHLAKTPAVAVCVCLGLGLCGAAQREEAAGSCEGPCGHPGHIIAQSWVGCGVLTHPVCV